MKVISVFQSRCLKAVFAGALLLLALLFLPACGTLSPRKAVAFPEPGADWTTLVGQLRYVTPERAVIGEVVVSHFADEHFQLDFLAGPGVPLMRLRESKEWAEAEGLFARGHWQGNPDRAGRLGSWMRLREVFSTRLPEKEGTLVRASTDTLPTAWNAELEWSNHRLTRVSVEVPKTKERFIFVFSR